MLKLFIMESFIDKPIVAGYSLRSIFEYWWIGLIVLVVAAIAAVATYVLLVWVFGRMKFKDGDKEKLNQYKEAQKEEKKTIAKETKGPVKNVITWRRMAPWFIPVVCVAALIVAAGSSFLPSAAFANLMFTLGGSHVEIIDTETSRAAAKEAEQNVITIQEEGAGIRPTRKSSLPGSLVEAFQAAQQHTQTSKTTTDRCGTG